MRTVEILTAISPRASSEPQRQLKVVELPDQLRHTLAVGLFLEPPQMGVDGVKAHCASARIFIEWNAGLDRARQVCLSGSEPEHLDQQPDTGCVLPQRIAHEHDGGGTAPCFRV